MKRPALSPTAQIALGLAMMACLLVLIANTFFTVFGDGETERQQARRALAESIALQGASLIQRGDVAGLDAVLRTVARRDPRIGSIVFRRIGGEVFAQAGDPPRWWGVDEGGEEGSTLDRIRVPLFAGEAPWGNLEIAYRQPEGNVVFRWIAQPIVLLTGFVFVAGACGFWLFIRRVLQHLDPSSVIPERVRAAFDTLIEGIVLVDGEGRVVLTNNAFRRLHPQADALGEGVLLSQLAWSAGSDADDPGVLHAWVRAMNTGRVIAGEAMRLGEGAQARDLQVSASPIRDGHDAVRGCLVSFADVTEVSRANEQLRKAMAELERSRAEIEAKNLALERAATRDPLTDCLNRRAFAAQGEPMLKRALRPDGRPIAAMMLDIDHFKSVNDRFGHAVGDRVIREVSAAMSEGVRPRDVLSRQGGEEFAVLLPDCDAATASLSAERLRSIVAERCLAAFAAEFPALRVTVSVGVADSTQGCATLDALLDHADNALYRAKRAGRDRVRIHDPSGIVEALRV
jgi:diguanylate cyclase (GGDEF)-like protein/PAS domain S-box-containing protein